MKLLKQQKNILFLLFVTFCLLQTTDSYAYITGFDTPVKRIETPTHDICSIFNKYIVISVAEGAEVGNMIVIRKRIDDKDFNCNLPGKGKELMTINGIESTETFYGIYGHLLFTESGTGPDGRGIDIYDLEKKKLVYSAGYSVGELSIKKNALTFYKDLNLKNKRECADAEKWNSQGFDYGFEQKTRVNLDSLREEAIGKITCSMRQ